MATAERTRFTPAFVAMARGVRELHRLACAGRDDSPEADAVRDATDRPWQALSEAERERIRGLSEDLYSLTERCEPWPMNPQAQTQFIAAYEARQQGDWDRALDLLRRWRNYVDSALLSYLRGTIWLQAGLAPIAVEFFAGAHERQPENPKYLLGLLHALQESDPGAARARASEILRQPEAASPLVVGRAAEIELLAARQRPEAEQQAAAERLAGVLTEALARWPRAGAQVENLPAFVLTQHLLATTFELRGRYQDAAQWYSQAISLDPTNDSLLVARGILHYGTSPAAAKDFERALAHGSPLIWPRLFLAHHYLLQHRFDDCRRMCEQALDLPATEAIRSELYEWLAIAQAEAGFPAEIVRRSFELSVQHDPGNERARRNLQAFNAVPSAPPPRNWETRTAGEIRSLSLLERRFATAA